jgi:hypothetical protein
LFAHSGHTAHSVDPQRANDLGRSPAPRAGLVTAGREARSDLGSRAHRRPRSSGGPPPVSIIGRPPLPSNPRPGTHAPLHRAGLPASPGGAGLMTPSTPPATAPAHSGTEQESELNCTASHRSRSTTRAAACDLDAWPLPGAHPARAARARVEPMPGTPRWGFRPRRRPRPGTARTDPLPLRARHVQDVKGFRVYKNRRYIEHTATRGPKARRLDAHGELAHRVELKCAGGDSKIYFAAATWRTAMVRERGFTSPRRRARRAIPTGRAAHRRRQWAHGARSPVPEPDGKCTDLPSRSRRAAW